MCAALPLGMRSPARVTPVLCYNVSANTYHFRRRASIHCKCRIWSVRSDHLADVNLHPSSRCGVHDGHQNASKIVNVSKPYRSIAQDHSYISNLHVVYLLAMSCIEIAADLPCNHVDSLGQTLRLSRSCRPHRLLRLRMAALYGGRIHDFLQQQRTSGRNAGA